ncbi:DUF1801 domain-containing protein [Pelagibacterium lacus]|uniref:DUF1801 domain-containing protein n=1 Tax=Pelagibacterium lacus TaxID=2282655 RepID=A0A369W5N2_9HYPH|nr:DUF1801 domain-containing protein [Pelagibacterium lacus]
MLHRRSHTGSKPVLWGSSIIGFGAYTYTNSANKSADWPLVGFSPRKANLTLYIVPGFRRHAELMQRLGKHTTGKSCLYIKRLSDIDPGVLEDLVTASVAYMRETYPTR